MTSKRLSFSYWYGDRVNLITDPECRLRVISGITIRPSGKLYELACGEGSSWHQDVEIRPMKENNVKVKGFKAE